jgi:hypothetical protein
MAPNRYTELFFLDEATALAAGHRPCFECRRQDFLSFARLWNEVLGIPGRSGAQAMDEVLHGERVDRAGRKLTWMGRILALPSGTFIRHEGQPHLVLSGSLLAWSADGYGETAARPGLETVDVLTPRSTVAVLSAGYRPMLHPSATVRRDAAEARGSVEV